MPNKQKKAPKKSQKRVKASSNKRSAKKAAGRKAEKAKRKSPKKATRTAKKTAKASRPPKKAVRTKAPTKAASKGSSPQSKPRTKAQPRAKPAHQRLPPSARHAVETDDPRETTGDEHAFSKAQLAEDEPEELGEQFVRGVTGDEADPEEDETDEEEGGPFVVTSAKTEFAYGTDDSNPEDAEVEGQPHVSPPVKPRT